MTEASVSVIIPTYNHAHYLAEAIESALAQSTPPAEVIVVDDGSTDNPHEVALPYPEVRLIHQENQGLAAARNTGWLAAGSRYVVFLDADDRLLPDALSANLDLFAGHPDCAFVYGAYRYLTERGIEQTPFRPIGDDPYATLLSMNCIGMHAAVMYQRDRIEEEVGFKRGLQACEDYDLYLRLARRFPVACAPTLVADYRIHAGNMSGDASLMLRCALRVLAEQEPRARSNAAWSAALDKGIENWKRYYSGVHLHKLRKALLARSVQPALVQEFAGLARQAPVAVARRGAGMLREALRERRKSRTFTRSNGKVRWGDLRRTAPFSAVFGFDRGRPIDRRYIESFLAQHARHIRGRALEVGDDSYTARFGGDRVDRRDVLNRFAGHPRTTFVGDLAEGAGLPSDAFDCVVLTQTLHLVYDMRAATGTLFRILRAGGVLLVTVPGITPIDRGEWGGSWYWSLTETALRRLLEEHFAPDDVETASYGNVLAAAAFLYGLADHELAAAELDHKDPCFPVLVAARATKGLGR